MKKPIKKTAARKMNTVKASVKKKTANRSIAPKIAKKPLTKKAGKLAIVAGFFSFVLLTLVISSTVADRIALNEGGGVLGSSASVPSGLSLKNYRGKVAISWKASSNAASYKVYRREGRGQSGSYIYKFLSRTASNYDTEVKANTSYTYKVTAIDRAGGESNGVYLSIVTPYVPVPMNISAITEFTKNGGKKVIFSWKNPKSDADKFFDEIHMSWTVAGKSTQKAIVRNPSYKTDDRTEFGLDRSSKKSIRFYVCNRLIWDGEYKDNCAYMDYVPRV